MVMSAPATRGKEEISGSRETPEKESIFAVVATHNTGHGESQAVLQLTENPQEAVDTARDAEKLGYQFYGDETGVYVYYLQLGKQYRKKEFEFSGDTAPINYPVIFGRYKIKGEWREEWFNETTKFIMGLH